MPARPKNAENEARLMKVTEAAKYMGTTPATLYSKACRREIPFVKLGRSLRFDRRDLDRLIEESKVAPQDEASDF